MDIYERVGQLSKKVFQCVVISAAILCVATAFIQHVQAQSDAPIDIAAIFSLTGQGAFANRSSVMGTRMAIDEINRQGGLLGRTLNLIFLDNMSTPIGSSLAANQAAVAKVVGIIGAQWSSHSLAIAQVAQQNQIPMVSNYSTHPKLTAIGDFIFRVCYTDNFQGKVMAEFASRDLKAASAVIIVDLASDYSLALSNIFRTHFESLGGKVLREVEYKAKSQDFDQAVRQTLAIKSDVVFLSGYEESGAIAHRLQSAGSHAIPLGGDGWADEGFMVLGGQYLKQGYYCTHWSASSTRKATADFVTKYGRNDDFGTGAALAYDAVMVLAQAVKRAGTTEGVHVARALGEQDAYNGVTGTIKFDAQGDPLKSAVIMEVRDGQPRYLKTLTPL